MIAILAEEETYHEYKKMKDYFKLINALLLEPIFFHPFVTYSAIRGDINLIRGKKGWGTMKRKGFQAKK
jgi:hypothetical protein